MRITVKQRGGFAGLEQDIATVDTARVDPAQARELEQQVRSNVLNRSRTGGSAEPVGADQFEYEITVEDGDRRDVVTWTDDGSAAAAPVRRLLTRLSEVR